MFLKHLINPRPTIILFFIVFCILFVAIPLLNYSLTPLFSHNWIPDYIVLITAIAIPSFHALGLNNLIYEKSIIRKDNLVIGFVYLLICTPFISTLTEWTVSFFLLFFLNYLLESYQRDYPFSQVFNASLILSILSFIAPNTAGLIILIIISGIYFSNLSWSSLATIIIGVSIPYLFYFTYCILTETNFIIPNFTAFYQLQLPTINSIAIPKLVWIIILSVISLVAFIELIAWLYKKSIRSRKSFFIIIFYLIITSIIALYSSTNSWYYIMTPLSVIIGNFFIYSRFKKPSNLLFILLVISSIYYRYMIMI